MFRNQSDVNLAFLGFCILYLYFCNFRPSVFVIFFFFLYFLPFEHMHVPAASLTRGPPSANSSCYNHAARDDDPWMMMITKDHYHPSIVWPVQWLAAIKNHQIKNNRAKKMTIVMVNVATSKRWWSVDDDDNVAIDYKIGLLPFHRLTRG